MYENIELSDVKTIINKLMIFIVLEGKSFVNEKDKARYVESYLSLLVNVINEPTNEGSSSKAMLMEHILKDISNYDE